MPEGAGEGAMGPAYGRPLRQAGDLRLLALPAGGGVARYCVAAGGLPVAASPAFAPALACFEAVRDADAADAAGERRRRSSPT